MSEPKYIHLSSTPEELEAALEARHSGLANADYVKPLSVDNLNDAAPDMYEALKEVLVAYENLVRSEYGSADKHTDIITRALFAQLLAPVGPAKAALEKAEGRE